jgi:hypothetical protein
MAYFANVAQIFEKKGKMAKILDKTTISGYYHGLYFNHFLTIGDFYHITDY